MMMVMMFFSGTATIDTHSLINLHFFDAQLFTTQQVAGKTLALWTASEQICKGKFGSTVTTTGTRRNSINQQATAFEEGLPTARLVTELQSLGDHPGQRTDFEGHRMNFLRLLLFGRLQGNFNNALGYAKFVQNYSLRDLKRQ